MKDKRIIIGESFNFNQGGFGPLSTPHSPPLDESSHKLKKEKNDVTPQNPQSNQKVITYTQSLNIEKSLQYNGKSNLDILRML